QRLHAPGIRYWGCALRFHCGSHRPDEGADVEHPDVLSLFARLRTLDVSRRAHLFSFRARPGYGRRVEHRRNAGCGDLAHASAGTGPGPGTGLMGLGTGWRGSDCLDRARAVASELALRVFCRSAAVLVTIWIRTSVPESEMWKKHQIQSEPKIPFSAIFAPGLRRKTIVLLLLNVFGLFAWWGLFTWMPPYLTLPVEKGRPAIGLMTSTFVLVT